MIYHPNNPGKVLNTTEVGTLLDEFSFQGYLPKTALLALLNQSDCVGIRVYYAAESSTDMSIRVLAVGVRQNGTEKDGRGGIGYILSQPIIAGSAAEAITLENRDDARDRVELAMGTNITVPFSSFFSSLMLQNLLADKLEGALSVPVAGIGFYVSRVPNTRITTHIGAAFSNPTNLQRMVNNPAFSHIQSDMPCPGVCSSLAPGVLEASASAETMASVTTSDTVIYLVKWNK